MKEKWTKGKWFVSDEARGGSIVCTLTPGLGVKSDDFPSDDAHFDAQLIAQAPAMYEMLKVIIDEREGVPGDYVTDIEIHQLLAKARGES